MAVQSYKDLIVWQESAEKEKPLDASTEVDRMLSGLLSSLAT